MDEDGGVADEDGGDVVDDDAEFFAGSCVGGGGDRLRARERFELTARILLPGNVGVQSDS